MFTGLGTGTAELITFGIRDTGNGTITAKCGVTATINRAIEAGGGIVKNARWLHNLGRQIFPELTAIGSRGGAWIRLPTFSVKPLRFD